MTRPLPALAPLTARPALDVGRPYGSPFAPLRRQRQTLPTMSHAARPTKTAAKTRPRFALGQIVATPGALEAARDHAVDVVALVQRHQSGDWGAVCADDARANDRALVAGARVLSAYDLPSSGGRATGGRLWVITEADRSATTVLLPSEY